jgi:hypothetical protein
VAYYILVSLLTKEEMKQGHLVVVDYRGNVILLYRGIQVAWFNYGVSQEVLRLAINFITQNCHNGDSDLINNPFSMALHIKNS